jgi:folate-binding protein YgfZ
MTSHPPISLSGYDAALSGAAFYRVPAPGLLRIAGQDRLDFVQRQTTNDARALTADRALLTVLTTAAARILDVWRLLVAPDGEALEAITLPGRGALTAQYLARRIFFMDKVTVADASADHALLEVLGPAAGDCLIGAGVELLPGPGAVVTAQTGGAALHLLGPEGEFAVGYLALGAPDAVAALAETLAAQGAQSLDTAAREVLRVEAGLPGPDGELTEAYTPLETNLTSAVHGAKGCYTGQEIIARQITYDKVTRRLAGLRLEEPVAAGAAVTVEGRDVGTVTSAAPSPRFGPLALAVIKRPHFAPGTAVALKADETSVAGTVVALPFAP